MIGGFLEVPAAFRCFLGHRPQEGLEVMRLHLARLNHAADQVIVYAILGGTRMLVK